MNVLQKIEKRNFREDIPEVRAGDLVRVHVKIREGEKERIQVFEGHVLKASGEGSRRTFTVRKISYGIGVERCFHLHSPRLAKVEIKAFGKVRQARIYYLRSRRGKAARVRSKKSRNGRI